MTDQEINIAIAESMGFTLESWGISHGYKLNDPAGNFVESAAEAVNLDDGWKLLNKYLPNYVADLNAMNDAETCLEGASVGNYGEELLTLTQQECMPVWNATSRQRAEAYLRTIGKWREGV